MIAKPTIAPLRLTTTSSSWNGTQPSILQRLREILGRALRESGQALDRSGQLLESFTWLPDKYVGADPPVRFQDFLSRHRQRMPLLHCGKPVVSPQVAFVAPCATLIGSVRVAEGASIWYGAILRADACYNAASWEQSDEDVLLQLEERTTKMTQQQQQQQEELEEGTKKNDTEDDDNLDEEERLAQKRRRMIQTVADQRQDVYSAGGGIYIGADTNLQDGVIVTAKQSSTLLGQGVTVGHAAQLHSCTVDDFALIGMGSLLAEGSHVETEALVAAGAVVPPHTTVRAGELWVGNPARKVRDLTADERQQLHHQSSEYVQVALTHPMELGDNLGPDLTWQEALREQMANEPNVHDQIARMNKWNNTVYGYLTRPKAPAEQLEAGGDDHDIQQVEEGTKAVSEGSSSDAEPKVAAAAQQPVEETAAKVEARR
mmetsp:Transcript_9572/g.26451  ORF Transcript_9572/g.26451 Transcript_9572/m.26451 type:complete len:431 (-) Transcript_9572:65-1357(-)|eukprot:CAMPEP_0168755658 /NCGR_PEP_ID=MMETSP0724-20121128/20188_1 /TAXON_ID=265536 /ORGANISM="Amphiprora sp., Strain CCMP467" /LENGTH=430 /DNA_ID=CAMNT_0008804291 /DNA_START=122 /DNA_END=1411 /DNA_ORIENTATION=+